MSKKVLLIFFLLTTNCFAQSVKLKNFSLSKQDQFYDIEFEKASVLLNGTYIDLKNRAYDLSWNKEKLIFLSRSSNNEKISLPLKENILEQLPFDEIKINWLNFYYKSLSFSLPDIEFESSPKTRIPLIDVEVKLSGIENGDIFSAITNRTDISIAEVPYDLTKRNDIIPKLPIKGFRDFKLHIKNHRFTFSSTLLGKRNLNWEIDGSIWLSKEYISIKIDRAILGDLSAINYSLLIFKSMLPNSYVEGQRIFIYLP